MMGAGSSDGQAGPCLGQHKGHLPSTGSVQPQGPGSRDDAPCRYEATRWQRLPADSHVPVPGLCVWSGIQGRQKRGLHSHNRYLLAEGAQRGLAPQTRPQSRGVASEPGLVPGARHRPLDAVRQQCSGLRSLVCVRAHLRDRGDRPGKARVRVTRRVCAFAFGGYVTASVTAPPSVTLF